MRSSNKIKNPWTYHLLSAVLILAFLSRIFQLNTPPDFYFDEVYHAFTAIAYSRNDPRGYEWWNPSPIEGTAYEWLHPPVSKLFMGLSIKLLGENSFAWRFPSAIFGTLVIALVFFLSKELLEYSSKTKPYATSVSLLAAFLASLDGLLLAQSRIAMNDIFLTTFSLAAILFYWRWFTTKSHKDSKKQLFLSSIFAGLAIATKWTGFFLLPIIGLIEGIHLLKVGWDKWKHRLTLLPLAYILIPAIIYLLSYSQFFLQGHTLDQFIELNNQTIRYETGLKATHPYQSPAWKWPLLLRPIWYYVKDYPLTSNSSAITLHTTKAIANIYALSNPLISWGGLIAFLWLIYKIYKTLSQKKFPMHYLLLAASYLLIWAPWTVSPRIMFYYHYTPAIPFLSIILAISLSHLYRASNLGKKITLGFILLTIAGFIFFFPIWTGIPVAETFVPNFFWLPSWR